MIKYICVYELGGETMANMKNAKKAIKTIKKEKRK